MELFTLEVVLIAIIIVGFAAFIHGALGIGFPMVSTPLLALVTDVQTAILMTLFPNIVINLISINHGGNWQTVFKSYWLLPASMVLGTFGGTVILIKYNPDFLRVLLAAALLFYVFNSMRAKKMRLNFIKSSPRLSMLGFGFCGGALGGTVNVSGPVLLIYLLESGLTSVAFIQILNICFLIGKVIQTATFASFGRIGLELVYISIPLLLVAIFTTKSGTKVRDRFSDAVYRKFLHGLLIVVALLLVWQFMS